MTVANQLNSFNELKNLRTNQLEMQFKFYINTENVNEHHLKFFFYWSVMSSIFKIIILCAAILFLSVQAQNIYDDNTIKTIVLRKRSLNPLTSISILLAILRKADEILAAQKKLENEIKMNEPVSM